MGNQVSTLRDLVSAFSIPLADVTWAMYEQAEMS
jgi:hypothetical protein